MPTLAVSALCLFVILKCNRGKKPKRKKEKK